MPSRAVALRREARPTISSTENRCSETVASQAASSGGSSGTLYSSANRKWVFGVMVRPSTLVRAERQKTEATAKRASRATAE